MELKYNKIYKYKQLQEIFNIYNKSGEQTIKEIEKNYLVKKVKRGFYKIERPLSKIEKIETQTYYKNKDYIEPMIYSMLLSSKGNSITMDMHQLMQEVEIVNKDFHYIKYHTKECSKIMLQENDSGIIIFTRESEPMLKRIIREVLYDMDDRQLIKVIEIPVIAYKIYNTEIKKYYIKNKEIVKDKDVQNLLEIKRNILKDIYNVEKESDLGYYDRGKFRDEIAKCYSAEYFYYKYHIILNKKGLTNCENYDIIGLKKSFNAYIQDKVKRSKQGNLKSLTKEEKDIYVKYCIDTKQDYMLRLKEKENE